MGLGDDMGVRVSLSSGDAIYLDATLEQAAGLFARKHAVRLEDRKVFVAHITQLSYGRVPSVEKLERLPED